MKSISLNGPIKLALKDTSAAIGIFDGVHRGHQYLIKKMLTVAKQKKLRPIVITFFPHPAHVMRPDVKLGYLTSLEERLRRLSDLGVETCLIITFNRNFSKIEPEAFIRDILVKKLGVKALFVGEDFRFGKDRSGDVELFKRLGLPCGYQMHAVAALKQGGLPISSTRIRQLMSEGKLKQAEKLLGRVFSVSGKVVKGDGRGRKLGYPTANVDYEADILPPSGIYAVKILLAKKSYPAVASLGFNPTFDNSFSKPCLEVYIFDFHKNIYGKHVQVQFLKKIRSEKKFKTTQALIQQIQKDIAFARQYLASWK